MLLGFEVVSTLDDESASDHDRLMEYVRKIRSAGGNKRRWLIALLASGLAAVNCQSAVAYDGASASNYADAYAVNRNTFWLYFPSDDCTNFVSQAIYAGGISRKLGWYMYPPSSTSYTTSWTVSAQNYSYMKLWVASQSGYWTAAQAGAYTPSWHLRGDPVYYDWTNNGSIDHASMMVGTGTDPTYNGWTGNVIDEPTSNRKRVIWNVKPYNVAWDKTSFYFLHIPTSAS